MLNLGVAWGFLQTVIVASHRYLPSRPVRPGRAISRPTLAHGGKHVSNRHVEKIAVAIGEMRCADRQDGGVSLQVQTAARPQCRLADASLTRAPQGADRVCASSYSRQAGLATLLRFGPEQVTLGRIADAFTGLSGRMATASCRAYISDVRRSRGQPAWPELPAGRWPDRPPSSIRTGNRTMAYSEHGVICNGKSGRSFRLSCISGGLFRHIMVPTLLERAGRPLSLDRNWAVRVHHKIRKGHNDRLNSWCPLRTW